MFTVALDMLCICKTAHNNNTTGRQACRPSVTMATKAFFLMMRGGKSLPLFIYNLPINKESSAAEVTLCGSVPVRWDQYGRCCSVKRATFYLILSD